MTGSNSRFPRQGRPWADLAEELQQRRDVRGDVVWDSTRNLKASYNASAEVTKLGWDAYTMFSGDNMIYSSSLYPSLEDIVDDVSAMTLELVSGPEGSAGTVTTGGTESIVLAVRTALNRARATRSIADKPQIILPSNAHAAFTKAAELMGIEDVRVPIRDYQADIEAMSQAITPNTIMMVGSAHAYPFGHVDNIEALGDVAAEHDVWLHVDACIGGFFLPFAVDLGHPVPQFDFQVPGVRSMSADLHKYGYTPRGASVLLLRDKTDAGFQGFEFSAWETGVFNTQTISGSRPAGAIAAAWAVLNHLGFEGYRSLVEKTLAAKAAMTSALENVDGLVLCGTPHGGLIAYRGTDGLDMFAVREGMSARGWQTGVTVDPPGFQMILNSLSGDIVEPFVDDISAVIDQVRSGALTATGADMSYGV
jgi:glutamate/tyrosine decarboxylase-like PLP-dependent enzyme